jgi:hypothetical protein
VAHGHKYTGVVELLLEAGAAVDHADAKMPDIPMGKQRRTRQRRGPADKGKFDSRLIFMSNSKTLVCL